MKKWLLILGMMLTIFSLTACGSDATNKTISNPMMTQEDAEQYALETINAVTLIVMQGMESDYEMYPAIYNALTSWAGAHEEMGNIVEYGQVTSEIGMKDAVISVKVKGEKRDAVIEIICDNVEGMTGFSVNPEYTFGESMTKAGLNTLVGMGTVFVILILISFIISGMKIIPKLQERFTKQPESQLEEKYDQVVEQIIEQEEQEEDDLELAAVIAAAIAASEGQASAEGFRVRSIKRANTSKWRKA